jgi:hypothetical protein
MNARARIATDPLPAAPAPHHLLTPVLRPMMISSCLPRSPAAMDVVYNRPSPELLRRLEDPSSVRFASSGLLRLTVRSRCPRRLAASATVHDARAY